MRRRRIVQIIVLAVAIAAPSALLLGARRCQRPREQALQITGMRIYTSRDTTPEGKPMTMTDFLEMSSKSYDELKKSGNLVEATLLIAERGEEDLTPYWSPDSMDLAERSTDTASSGSSVSSDTASGTAE